MSEKALHDNVPGRGKREPTLVGRSLFVGLRALDPLLQYSILLNAPLSTFLPKLNVPAPAAPPNSPIVPATGLGPVQSVLWFMSIGGAVKQIFHMVFISNERMLPSFPFLWDSRALTDSEQQCTFRWASL